MVKKRSLSALKRQSRPSSDDNTRTRAFPSADIDWKSIRTFLEDPLTYLLSLKLNDRRTFVDSCQCSSFEQRALMLEMLSAEVIEELGEVTSFEDYQTGQIWSITIKSGNFEQALLVIIESVEIAHYFFSVPGVLGLNLRTVAPAILTEWLEQARRGRFYALLGVMPQISLPVTISYSLAHWSKRLTIRLPTLSTYHFAIIDRVLENHVEDYPTKLPCDCVSDSGLISEYDQACAASVLHRRAQVLQAATRGKYNNDR